MESSKGRQQASIHCGKLANSTLNMEIDSDYEFNAPKYIDFLSNESENEYTDAWFGKSLAIVSDMVS